MSSSTSFRIIFPRGTIAAHKESCIRAVSHARNLIPAQMKQYELEHPDFAALTVGQRESRVMEYLIDFKTMLESTSQVARQAQEEKPSARRHHHFSISFADLETICTTQNAAELLDGIMRDSGGYVSEKLFHQWTGRAFEEYVQRVGGADAYLLGSVEIFFSKGEDVKRMCYLVMPRLGGEQQEEIFSEVLENFPDAAQLMQNSSVRAFLADPTSGDPDMLAQVLSNIRLANPDMARHVEAHLDDIQLEGKYACAQCQKRGDHFAACGQCKRVRYCGRDCQVKHWKVGHKKECITK